MREVRLDLADAGEQCRVRHAEVLGGVADDLRAGLALRGGQRDRSWFPCRIRIVVPNDGFGTR